LLCGRLLDVRYKKAFHKLSNMIHLASGSKDNSGSIKNTTTKFSGYCENNIISFFKKLCNTKKGKTAVFI
jgi:hypothetical protein